MCDKNKLVFEEMTVMTKKIVIQELETGPPDVYEIGDLLRPSRITLAAVASTDGMVVKKTP